MLKRSDWNRAEIRSVFWITKIYKINQQTNNIRYKNYNKLFLFFTHLHPHKITIHLSSFVITFENCCLNNKCNSKIYRKTLIRILEQKYQTTLMSNIFIFFIASFEYLQRRQRLTFTVFFICVILLLFLREIKQSARFLH